MQYTLLSIYCAAVILLVPSKIRWKERYAEKGNACHVNSRLA
jgi:hypothetical protein